MVGRWPNGTPITFASSDTVQSEINFNINKVDQNLCPYAAHIRKTAPRDSLVDDGTHHIIRRGIQFGDEVRSEESQASHSDFIQVDNGRLDYAKEQNFRGLHFVCYQSDISNGFRFQQITWCNNEIFPGKVDSNEKDQAIIARNTAFKGIDPLVGQVDALKPRDKAGKLIEIAGMKDPTKETFTTCPMPYVNELIMPAGGEYFFVPSLKALKQVLGTSTSTSGSTSTLKSKL